MRFAEHKQSDMVDLVDDALAAYAKARDYRVPLRSDQEYCPVMKHATIRVPGLKVAVPLPADAIPQDLVPMEGPAGEPVIELVLEGGSLTALAKLNGKNYRKMLKNIAEHGAGNVAVVLQGVLRRRPPRAGRLCSRVPGSRSTSKRPGRPGKLRNEARARIGTFPRWAGYSWRIPLKPPAAQTARPASPRAARLPASPRPG